MAHYSHHDDRLERAERSHGHSGLILTAVALLMLAALAWLWTQQLGVDSPLPQSVAAVSQPAAPAKAAMSPATAAPVAVLAPAPVIQPAPATLMPPSDAVAAAGDTRAAR